MTLNAAVLVAFVLLGTGDRSVHHRFGDWVVWKTSDMQIASTENDAGATLGIICFNDAERCRAFIITTNSCRDGSEAPMMLNSAAGSASITTTCRHFPDKGDGKITMMSVVNEYDRIRDALESGGLVGIAMPMENGAFRVLRFSTGGATLAIKDAMRLPPDHRSKSDSGTAPASEYY